MTSNTGTSNVFKMFPGKPSAIELYNGDELISDVLSEQEAELVEKVREDSHISALVMMLIQTMGKHLIEMGFDPAENPQEYCFISESIISFVMAQYGKEHVLQQLAEHTITIEDHDDLAYKFIPPNISKKPKTEI